MAPAQAAAPVVAASNATTFDADITGGLVVTLASGTAAGNLLIVCAVHDTSAPGGFTFPAGWTRFWNSAPGSSTGEACGYRIADGGEGATITVTSVNAGAEDGHAIALRITGAHASQAPEVGTATSGTSANPDPPTLTASWGAEDNLFIAFTSAGSTSATFTPPSGYTGTVSNANGSGTDASSAVSFLGVTADATDDPGTWTLSGSTTWHAQTIVVRPASAAASCAGRLALLGVGC